MLISLSLIMLCGLLFGWICKRIHLPGLIGMIFAGILLGPHALDLIDGFVLAASADIRRIALIVILLRAGLKLDLKDLKKEGRSALLMCFVPACFEITGMIVLAPRLLGISILDAAIMGAVVGAVSPAVIVPRMIKLIDGGYGSDKGIPQMILAGASVDDVFVIVMFTSFTGMAQGKGVSVMNFVNIPVSIVTGITVGLLIGMIIVKWYGMIEVNDTVKVIILMAVSMALSAFENTFSEIPFASLIAIMGIGVTVRKCNIRLAKEMSQRYDRIWMLAEIFLFALVGTSVAISSALSAEVNVILLLAGVLVFRMVGVFICLIGTELCIKEKLFCMIAYMPKATVQAAIGGLPLAMGLSCGEIVLTVSVIAILVTAPLGAFGIDLTYKKLLTKS